MATRNFNVKNGLTAGNITLDATTNTTTTANLVVTGNVNLTTAANVALGSNSNVKLTGGSSGQYLQTDGTGNLSWQSISGATSIANGTSNVRIPVANGNVVVSVNGVANTATFTSNAVFRGTYGLTGAISQANTAPSNPQNGDQWYNTFNGILFEYLDDGTSSQWVDISSLPTPNLASSNAGAVLNNVQTTGTYFPAFISSTANANYALSSNTAFSANFANGAMIATTFVGALSGAATTAGTVTTAAQPNITSVGTLTGLSVTGNATAGNVYANSGTIGASLLTGTLTTAAQPNITSVGTLTSLGVSGNITVQTYILSSVAAANSEILAGADGSGFYFAGGLNRATNIPVFVGGSTGNIVFRTNANGTGGGQERLRITNTGNVGIANSAPTHTLSVTGTTNISGNANVGNLGTAQVLATANITAPQLISNVATGTAPLVVTSTTQVANLSVATAGSATTAGTVTTAAQPNITSVGTLTSLGVNGTVTAVAFTANTGVFTGNANGLSSIQGANVVGTVPSATTAGTVTTAAQPNITSVGTLTSATVTGNVAAGNLTTTGVLSVTGTGVSSIAGNLDMTSNTIINLATPTNATDAATKQYVDDVAQGLHTHDSCNAATSTTLAVASGGTVTYNNGSSGVGATLTTTGSYTTIDGVTLSNGMRILVKNEANAAHNGIYDRTSTTVLTRSTDFDTSTEMAGGDFTFVTAGTLYDNTGWVMTDPVTTVGTTAVNWVQFSGAGTYTAGTGLTLTGSQFSVNASQTQITSVGTLTGLNSSGTITAPAFTANTGVFTGNGSGLSAIAGANVTGTVSSATTAGTVTTAAQPNITSVGTLTSLAVTGAVTADTFQASNNGGGTNFRVGDDAWIGDVNQADTISIRGLQNAANGYIVFGNADVTTKLGRSGSGALTYNGTVNPTTLQTTTLTTGANTTAGTVTGNWTLTAGSRWQATYADLAEKYAADATYEPGTVLLFGGEQEVTLSNAFDSTKVAGVVTTNPAYSMNAALEAEHIAEIALQGRVPCKVLGPVSKGDLMVSATNGYAIANNEARAGTIIGKALENFNGEFGIVEVAVGRF